MGEEQQSLCRKCDQSIDLLSNAYPLPITCSKQEHHTIHHRKCLHESLEYIAITVAEYRATGDRSSPDARLGSPLTYFPSPFLVDAFPHARPYPLVNYRRRARRRGFARGNPFWGYLERRQEPVQCAWNSRVLDNGCSVVLGCARVDRPSFSLSADLLLQFLPVQRISQQKNPASEGKAVHTFLSAPAPSEVHIPLVRFFKPPNASIGRSRRLSSLILHPQDLV